MSILNDPNMIRSIIMDHYQYPRNKVDSEPKGYESIHMDSDSCVDDFYIYLKYDNTSNKIIDVKFMGTGCTISTASISIMSELLINKTKDEAFNIINNYKNMAMHEGSYDEELLEEANVFSNVYKQANRIKCATIGYNGIEELLKDK